MYAEGEELEDEEAKVEERAKLTLEQVKKRREAEIKKVIFEACCGEESKKGSHFKDKGGESVRRYLPEHNVSKGNAFKALKAITEILNEEGHY